MAFDKIVGVDGTTYQFPTLVRTRISDNIKQVGSLENLAVIDALGPALATKSATTHNHTLASLSSNNIDELGDVEIGVVGSNGIALQDKHTLVYEQSTLKWRNKVASGGVTVGETRPASPIPGDAWFDSNDGTLYVFYQDANTSQWVQVQANSALEGTILSRLGSVEARATALEAVPDYSPNYIINGGFDILQRGQSVNITGAHFSYKTADRWLLAVSATGSTNIDNAIIAFPDGGAIIDGLSVPYFMRWTVNTLGTATAYGMINRMEDVRTLAGSTVTLSFYVRGTQTSTIRPSLIQYFGPSGSADVTTFASSTTTTTFNSTWTRKTFTFNVPSVLGKTINAGSFIQVQLDALSISTGTMEIAGVQLELGSVATPFRRAGLTIQGELAACQRYFEKSYNQSDAPGTSTTVGLYTFYGTTDGSSNVVAPIKFSVPKRIASGYTLTTYNSAGTSNQVEYGRSGAGSTTASPTLYRANDAMFHIYTNTGVAWAASYIIFHWTCSAEL